MMKEVQSAFPGRTIIVKTVSKNFFISRYIKNKFNSVECKKLKSHTPNFWLENKNTHNLPFDF